VKKDYQNIQKDTPKIHPRRLQKTRGIWQLQKVQLRGNRNGQDKIEEL
jgi:hypothetical protein